MKPNNEERKIINAFCSRNNIREHNRITINGMKFDVDFRVERDKEVTAWVSSDEGIPAETVLNWLSSLGLRPEKKEVVVEWAD